MTEEEFWAALSGLKPNTDQPVYRLYYDDQGYPLFYSMEVLPGNYIELDADTWHGASVAQVIDGKIIRHPAPTVPKLIPSTTGTACDPIDITVVVIETKPHTKWSLR